jgi:mRNA interferase MazF
VGRKKRPAVVISFPLYNQERPDVILMAITSQIQRTGAIGEVLLGDWSSAGLIKPSAIKPVVFTAEKSLVSKKLGHLVKDDLKSLRESFRRIFG